MLKYINLKRICHHRLHNKISFRSKKKTKSMRLNMYLISYLKNFTIRLIRPKTINIRIETIYYALHFTNFLAIHKYNTNYIYVYVYLLHTNIMFEQLITGIM